MLALVPVPCGKIGLFIAVLPISYLTGLLAMIAPGGVGVREASMVIGLSLAIPESVAISLALLLRILWLVLEAAGGMAPGYVSWPYLVNR